MRDWKKLPVTDHGKGITDDVENAPTSFQEVCENLSLGRRSGDLETRDGSEYFLNDAQASLQTPTKIRQLLRLEDYIFAYCYDDPGTPGDPIVGNFYWIKEDGSSTAWTIVETARDEASKRGWNLSASLTSSNRIGEGFEFYWLLANWSANIFATTYYTCDHVAGLGTAFTVAVTPGTTSLDLRLNLDFIDGGRLFSSGAYTPGTEITYGDIKAALEAAVSDEVTAYIGTTIATDLLTLNGAFGKTVTRTINPMGDYLPVFTKEGHLNWQEWQGHLYVSLEPYDKSFVYNVNDPDATDPDTYPPDNDREPLKKLYILWREQLDIPKCTNAQLPKSFTAVEREATDSNFSFYEFDCALLSDVTPLPPETSHAHDLVGTPWLMGENDPMIKLWIERGPTEDSVFDAPSALPTDRANTAVLTKLIIDVFPSYQNDSGATAPTIPTVYDEFDTEWSTSGFAAYYYAHTTKALLVLIPSSFVETTMTGGLNDRTSAGESIRLAIETAFQNYNARPNVNQLTKGHHAPLNVSTAWRNNLEPSTVAIGQNFNDAAGSGAYMWYRSAATAGGDGGSAFPSTRGIIKTMFVKAQVVLLDQYINSARILYSYGAYAREEYVALVENTPRTFIFDGPSELIQIGTISDLREEGTHDQVTVLHGLTAGVDKASGYLIDYNQMESRLARTEDGGTVYYDEVQTTFFIPVVGLATPPTGSPWDTGEKDWLKRVSIYGSLISEKADAQINVESEAYFNAQVLTYDALPQSGSYYFTVVNQVGIYGNVFGANQRAYQSSPGIPHSAPASFFDDFDDPISSLNNFQDKAIVWTPITTWRIEGIRGATGSGRTFIRKVSDEYGSISNEMVVRTNKGLFFWSKIGICYTNGLTAMRVTDHLIETYEGWLADNLTSDDEIGNRYMRGQYNEKDQRIYWSIKDSDGHPIWVIMDIYGELSNKMPIRTASGHVLRYENSASAIETLPLVETDSTYYSEKTLRFYRSQNREILVHDKAFPMDEYNVETADFDLPAGYAIQNEVLRLPIKPFMKSVGFSYGMKGITKWTHRVMISMKEGNKYGVAIQPLGWNDFGEKPHLLGGALNYQNMDWSADYDVLPDPNADLKQFFRHLDVAFLNKHHIIFRRRFPRGRIRNIYKQFGFRELPINTGTITTDSNNIDSIVMTQKTTDFIEIRINTSDLADNAVLDKGLDSSGAWYIGIDGFVLGLDKWFVIESVLEVTASDDYILFVKPDDFNISAEATLDLSTVTIFKVPEEQKLALLDYEMTYAFIGDRSLGIFKSTELGGDNG